MRARRLIRGEKLLVVQGPGIGNEVVAPFKVQRIRFSGSKPDSCFTHMPIFSAAERYAKRVPSRDQTAVTVFTRVEREAGIAGTRGALNPNVNCICALIIDIHRDTVAIGRNRWVGHHPGLPTRPSSFPSLSTQVSADWVRQGTGGVNHRAVV